MGTLGSSQVLTPLVDGAQFWMRSLPPKNVLLCFLLLVATSTWALGMQKKKKMCLCKSTLILLCQQWKVNLLASARLKWSDFRCNLQFKFTYPINLCAANNSNKEWMCDSWSWHVVPDEVTVKKKNAFCTRLCVCVCQVWFHALRQNIY